VSAAAIDIQSIYGLLNIASGKDPTKLMYRTLNLPKNSAINIFIIEGVDLIKSTLPEGCRDAIDDIKDAFDKSLISTTSINGKTLDMLTTNRQKVEVNNPNVRRGFMQSLGKRPDDGGG
jgi:hypothetical protein